MDSLPHRHLTTLTLVVDFAGVTPIGATPAGQRGIAPVTGGTFKGDRLSGTVLPGGHDWFITRADGQLAIDVRLTLRTGDGVLIYLAYRGLFRGSPEVMAKFRKGAQLDPADYSIQVVATLECGDSRYSWLNDLLVVAVGEQTPTGPIYHLFEIG
jgi:hypothetical protein